MKNVLITRPEPGATETAARLTALGLFPIVAPVLSIVAQDTRAPDRVAATILTSRNALAACSPSLFSRPIFAVGTATASLAMRAGFSRVYNADGDAKSLVDLILNTMSATDGTLYLPAAQRQGIDLAASLRQSGFRVARRVAYRAAGVPALPETAVTFLSNGMQGSAMFFSGETSRHFVRLVRAAKLTEALRDVEAVSISERAAVALRTLPWRQIMVAAKPTQDEMLVLLK